MAGPLLLGHCSSHRTSATRSAWARKGTGLIGSRGLTCLGLLGRQQILEQYAQHLSMEELHQLASLTSGCSGRDLRDLCEQAERHWAAKVPL